MYKGIRANTDLKKTTSPQSRIIRVNNFLNKKSNYAEILDFATRGKLALRNANLVLFTKQLNPNPNPNITQEKWYQIPLVENFIQISVSKTR